MSLQQPKCIQRAWSRLAVPVLAAAGTPGVGYDVSFPQCNGTGTQALPAAPSIGIVGVNDGRPFTPNPCLAAGLA